MSKIQAPKGTLDVLPAESWKWQTVERIARQVSELYHFEEIRLPIFEHTELFQRGVGEATDIVTKEMYTFEDRGGRSITLRPEPTAGIVRAMIEHNALADPGSRAKVYFIGPVFRYENVQKGRLRQHHQFGVEAFGVAEPEQDVECILLQLDFYRRCGLKEMSLRVNSLGDRDSKARYRDALRDYFKPLSPKLSEDSRRRLETNPLRILDSKDQRDQEAIRAAPPSVEFLSDRSRKHLERVQELLKRATATHPVPTSLDPTLVRGFDYYTDTLWEVTTTGLGAQNAIGGGGRYDNLVEQLGGRATPAVGFGIGIERILLSLEAQGVALPRSSKPLIWLITHGDAARDANLRLLRELRSNVIAADMDLGARSVKSQFKLADRENASYCLVLGETELADKTVVLKDLKTGEQSIVPRDEIVARLKTLVG